MDNALSFHAMKCPRLIFDKNGIHTTVNMSTVRVETKPFVRYYSARVCTRALRVWLYHQAAKLKVKVLKVLG